MDKVFITDKQGNRVLPKTHFSCVLDDNGTTLETVLQGKQDTLVSGTNIKTINNQSILGSGNITIQGGGSSVQSDWNQTDTEADDYIKNKPTIPTVPTNVSAFNNDAGYLTQHQSLSDYIQKSQTAGLIKNDGTIDTNIYLTQHQDISGKADKSEMSVTDGTGADADKTTITLKSGTSATVLKSHQSLSGKQDVIDSSHKLSADLVDDTNTANKFTNATEKQTWNGKQDVINDLATIRSGASAGATAYQKPAGGIPKTDLAQGVKDSLDKADTALQEDTLYEDANGHDYVEIGGMKWATKNIGANAVTDAGLYFQWGDIQGYTAEQVGTGEGKKAFTWADYKFSSDAQGSSMTKYNSTDGKTVLDLEDDAARANWGGTWRMPTTEEMQAFGAAVNAVWTDDYQGSGVAGLVCTDKMDNTKVVFFPAAGCCGGGSVGGVGSGGYCWYSSLHTDSRERAYGLYFDSDDAGWDDGSDRYYGFSVRPILDTTQLKQDLDNKQNTLVSGTNIKTINNQSLLGGGNISVAAELPSNLAYLSNDNGDGIIPSDGIRAVTVTSAAAMTINPDVVTVIDGAVGTAAITLQVPNDNLAHVWDILLTTDSTVAITFAMSNSATILYPNGFSVGASKAVEISVIGVGTKYYLRYGEFA